MALNWVNVLVLFTCKDEHLLTAVSSSTTADGVESMDAQEFKVDTRLTQALQGTSVAVPFLCRFTSHKDNGQRCLEHLPQFACSNPTGYLTLSAWNRTKAHSFCQAGVTFCPSASFWLKIVQNDTKNRTTIRTWTAARKRHNVCVSVVCSALSKMFKSF